MNEKLWIIVIDFVDELEVKCENNGVKDVFKGFIYRNRVNDVFIY